ncbi:MAG: hypothetical protein FJY67_03945 [Calditrichaeota bacterium]|nr:hypothetical protein [Calditrichota bacterium]
MRIVFTLPTLIFLLACSDNNPTSTGGGGGGGRDSTVHQIMPLGLGNWWAFHSVVTLQGMPFIETEDTLRIDTTFERGAGVWFGGTGDSIFFRNSASGLRRLIIGGNYPGGFDELFIKYPARVGDEWITPSDSAVHRVTATDGLATVPAGRFGNCIVITQTLRQGTINQYYFKPFTGTVQIDGYLDFFGVPMESQTKLTALGI